MSTLAQDLRFAARWLRKNPGFTAVAVLTLALGIGANTALFSVMDSVLLKPMPVKDPERLVLLEWEAGRAFRTSGRRGSGMPRPEGIIGGSIFRYDTIERMREAWRQQAGRSPLSDLFEFAPLYDVTASVEGNAEIVHGEVVSGGYHAGLGVPFALGRGITERDDEPGAVPVAVLAHSYWKQRLGGRTDILGRPLRLNQTVFTVIGVTAPGFHGAQQVDYLPDVTVPLHFEPALLGEDSGMARHGKPGGIWWINLMGRLKPGFSRAQAAQSLGGVFQNQALAILPPPRRDGEPAHLEPKDYPRLIAVPGGQGLREHRRSYERPIYGLFLVVALVLLIACANLANLLLARAALRRPEIGARLALGAGRGRLVRQLLTESVLLAVLGGAAGTLFAVWGKTALVGLAAGDSRFVLDIDHGLDVRVLAFTLGISLATGVLFGLAPAWRTTRLDLATTLRQSRRTTATRSRLRNSLVVVQVALSVLILAGAGLFLRTLYNLETVRLGFNQERLLVFTLQPRQAGYKDERLLDFYRRLSARLDAIPGVRAATFGCVPLIADYTWDTSVLLPGESERTAVRHYSNLQTVRENFFEALEIPRLRGRGFTEQDDAHSPRVAVVNQAFARKYFPGQDPMGKSVRESEQDPELEIVGVVGDTKYDSQRKEIEPLLFTPWRQRADVIGEMRFALRTSGDPTALAETVRRVVREIDSSLPVTEIGTQEDRSRANLSRERLYARLLTFFGAIAMSLAAIGLSGVLGYSVAQRTNEIGIRMALGARRPQVVRMIVLQGLRPTLAGLVLGLAASLASGRILGSLVYGVGTSDPATLIAVAMILVAVAGLAAFLPARRAARVDPIVALRTE
ncbi:MAG TPA: ABC transporter permease [Thermoanaerobaculia bacterium]|jgi:predicted permease